MKNFVLYVSLFFLAFSCSEKDKVSKNDNTFLSGTFTTEKTFQYYNEANITGKIHTVTPENLVTDATYKFALYGISAENWVDLVIQTSFIAK